MTSAAGNCIAVNLVRWKMKLQILFSTFKEFTAWKVEAASAMLPLKTEYVLHVVLQSHARLAQEEIFDDFWSRNAIFMC